MIYINRNLGIISVDFKLYIFLVLFFSLINPSLILLYSLFQYSILPKLLILKNILLFSMAFIFLTLISFALKIKVISKSNLFLGIFYILILNIYLLLSFFGNYFHSGTLIYYIKFITIGISLTILTSLYIQKFEIFNFLRVYRLIGWIIVSFGLLEYSLPIETIWSDIIKIQSFMGDTEVDPWASVPLGQSGRFYSWDLFIILGDKLRRLVSIYADPTLTANVLVLLLNIFLFLPNKKFKDKLLLVFIVLSGFFTLSKFFILSFLTSIFFYFTRLMIRNIIIYTLIGALIISIVLINIFDYIPSSAHIEGLISAFTDFQLFGRGLGQAGNYATFSNIKPIGGESSIGSILAQIGIFSFLLIYQLNNLLNLITLNYKKIKKINIENKNILLFILEVAYVTILEFFIGLLFSESTISGTTVIITFISILPILGTIIIWINAKINKEV
ncbi:MAG: hypothetical protein KatS3mg068_2341 [Candidatus Sericytochromatia bacterium]|nr:MAG: hypothetical protein KatS3mg068_2341 [Candidatus Sericytochromatia bacterium]GIX42975.1 MAG: hypothetical protein KatS3mg129_2708 [Leptospiraceae bacterium]